MKKVNVTTGIYWVESPEDNLYVLCGCPADCTKHLMRRGLIQSVEIDGVACETGPNAILLSDVALQNERFSNLGEFPVLQMLYRQGLILPNHPNNTGLKPMIIGIKDQVEAQAAYIYIGNYGLPDVDDIIEAGIPEARARDIMRFKKKFAFDNILPTDKLLDLKIVGDDPVEIRPGVFIERLHPNVYVFRKGEEEITVDLALGQGEEYQPAYDMGFHRIRREYFSVIHTGEGDGWDINRPCMASIVTFQGKIYLIDAGPNMLHSLTALGISVNEIEGIFHTHAHDDHFNGLTILMRCDHRIKYFATKLVRRSVEKKLAALLHIDPERITQYFDVHDLEFDEWNNIEGLEVRPVLSPHPVETSIMFFRALWGAGYKTYAHLADIAAFKVIKGMITDDPKKSGMSQEFYDTTVREYLTPVNIKKIDNGGGLIHGAAIDFKEDKSDKIILSHRATPLTEVEREIGAGTSFGMPDVLIPSEQDLTKSVAFRHFQVFFPTVPPHELRMLLNCPVVTFNPGAIMIKKGEVNENMYFMLSGTAEFIATEYGVLNKLASGSMAGELSGIKRDTARGTFRAGSIVRALKIPCSLYTEFLKRNDIYDQAYEDINTRRFLQNTWLFGDMVSCPIKNSIVRVMNPVNYKKGEPLTCPESPVLFLVHCGGVDIEIDGIAIESITTNNFFGEENILFGKQEIFHAKAAIPSRIFHIPASTIAGIPIVQWKLLETYDRRVKAAG